MMKGKLSKRKVKCIVVVIGVIIIPLLYSLLYLGAFWDPYSRLETLPVAVVNNDKGADINDEDRNAGAEMCDRLKEDGSLKFIFTNEEEANEGTKSDKYYAMILIPENFSENIASAGEEKKQAAVITYSANEKRNYLASQILSRAVLEIEESTRSNINKEIVEELASNIKAVPDEMTELKDGIGDLYDGSLDLQEGTNKLADGTGEFEEKFGTLKSGTSDLKKGSKILNTGIESLDDGLEALVSGATKLESSTANIGDISKGAKSLASGATTFNAALIQYTAGVDNLIASVNSTGTFLKEYVTKVNPSIMRDPVFAGFMMKLSSDSNTQAIQTLQAAGTKLKEASETIATGAAKLSKGSKNLPKLKEAIQTLSKGLETAKEGSKQLQAGSASLYSGVTTLNDGAIKLGDAASEIADGAEELDQGALTLSDGVKTAKDGVETSITDTNEQLKTLEGLSDFAAEPVTIEANAIDTVPNYGTAFAPYFLSLSLWVGALIIFVGIYLDADGKFKILSRESQNKIARSFIYLIIGLAQAVILAILLIMVLGLKVDSMGLYFASCCLVSMVSIAIVQFFMIFFKDVGKFIAMVLLILQLTSCAGTFPMETVPKIFNLLYPFMPMTYAVGLFKQAISGVDKGEVVYNGGILCLIIVGFMVLTLIFSSNKVYQRISKTKTA